MPASASLRRTVRGQLFLLVVAVLVPALTLSAVLAVQVAAAKRQALQEEAHDLTAALTRSFDGEIARITSSLQTLAALPSIQAGDLALFYRQAVAAPKNPGQIIVLFEPSGQIVFDTSRPFGTPLPRRTDMAPLQPVFEGAGFYVSDLITSSVTSRFVYAVTVPVWRRGAVDYALGMATLIDNGASPMLSQEPLPSGWLAGVFDRQGVVVARSLRPEATVGQPATQAVAEALKTRPEGSIVTTTREGIRTFTAWRRSASSGWTVAVGVPEAQLLAPLWQSLWMLAGAALVTLSLSLILAAFVARRISGPIKRLEAVAATLGRSKGTTAEPVSDLGLVEANAVGQALAASATRYHAVFDTAVDAIVVIDGRGAIHSFNQSAERMFGYTAEEIVGENVRRLMPEPDRSRHDGYIANYLRSGVAKFIGIGREVAGLRKDGSTFPLDLAIAEWRAGNVPYFTGIMRDVTERKQAEEALRRSQRMEAVGQLAGGVAHDFNNLLGIIIGNLETIASLAGGRPELMQRLEPALRAASRGRSLTGRLLSFSRHSPLAPVPTDVNAVIAGLGEMMRGSLTSGIALAFEPAPDLWLCSTDPNELEDAIVNLALNARDAMSDGGRLAIRTRNVDEVVPATGLPPGRYVEISIDDTGRGMPKEVADRAFEPFFTTKDVGKGTGLGLSMVYGFAKRSRGHVAIFSEVGRGTSVRLILPAAERGAAAAAEPRPSGHAVATGRRTILLVDDEADLRTFAVELLERRGYTVLAAEGPVEALRILRTGAPVDLLFTDVVMPGGMNGYGLVDEALRLRPELEVLMTSGFAARQTGSKHRWLDKPYQSEELIGAVHDALRS